MDEQAQEETAALHAAVVADSRRHVALMRERRKRTRELRVQVQSRVDQLKHNLADMMRRHPSGRLDR